MVIETLLDIFRCFEGLGTREAIRFTTDYRSSLYSYRDLWLHAGAYGGFLSAQGLREGHRILLWSENRPEWVFAFWGAISRGIQVVPVDPGSSPQLVTRLSSQSDSRLILLGQNMPDLSADLPALRLPPPSQLAPVAPPSGRASPEDIAEIIFTSGATGTPKGILHRHRSLTSNLGPFEAEFHRYRYLAAPFQPIRILCLLPLSHLFGQVMSLFIPPLLGGSLVLVDSLIPGHVVEHLRTERVSVLVTVPRILDQITSFLQLDRERTTFQPRFHGLPGIATRWWHYRSIHRRLGWKFWSVVVGGAALARELEDAWSQIGVLVIQGYGLTEAGPIISVNHPFHAHRGSLGHVLQGQEIRLSEKGEIQVRGGNVSLEYLEDGKLRRAEVEHEWLPTGDIGELDAEGNLYFKGRKKDVIITAEGLNVFPEDVESALLVDPGVREAAAVGIDSGRGEEVHAVLVLRDASVDPESVIRSANLRLEGYQRIQHWSVWEGDELPRTPSTLKLRRHEIRAQIESGRAPSSPRASSYRSTEEILAHLASRPTDTIHPEDRLEEDLGFSSLDRIELLQDLEQLSGRRLNESEFSGLHSVSEIERWLRTPEEESAQLDRSSRASAASRLRMPRWATRAPVRLFRAVAQRTMILPLLRHYLPLTVVGLSRLEALQGASLIMAANHQSHLDTVALLAALPPVWRKRLAPAMQMERFAAHFSPAGRPISSRVSAHGQYLLACLLFNTYPLPQSGARFRTVLRYTGALLDRGYCPLVFPEGRRTEDGRIHEFHAGVALMAKELKVPILPIRIEGLFDVMPPTSSWPKPRPVWIGFGDLLEPTVGETPEEIARQLRDRILDLYPKPA
ncbi:MAG: AMP-binding protein [Acidobacteriota bacterium]